MWTWKRVATGKGHSMKDAHTQGNPAAVPQRAPEGDGAIVLHAVMQDLRARAEAGLAKYGTYLRTHNGRDALIDAYQDALDLCMYLKQAIMERGGGGAARKPEGFTLIVNSDPLVTREQMDLICAAWDGGALSEGLAMRLMGVSRLSARGHLQMWRDRQPPE